MCYFRVTQRRVRGKVLLTQSERGNKKSAERWRWRQFGWSFCCVVSSLFHRQIKLLMFVTTYPLSPGFSLSPPRSHYTSQMFLIDARKLNQEQHCLLNLIGRITVCLSTLTWLVSCKIIYFGFGNADTLFQKMSHKIWLKGQKSLVNVHLSTSTLW